MCTPRNRPPAPGWLHDAILAAGWPEAQAHRVCLVAGCESGFHPNSHNASTGVYGLMQIMARSRPWSVVLAAHGWTADDLYDPVKNLTVAREGWEQTSWAQWQCAGATDS